MKNYADYKVGERIELYYSGEKFSPVPTSNTIWATVIAKNNGDNNSYAVGYPLVGWTSNEIPLLKANWNILAPDGKFNLQMQTAMNIISTIASYCYGWFVYPDESLIVGSKPQALTITGPDGLMCGWCGNFYPMASSNQNDGSLKCYSCRSTFKITKLY